ncbi:signal transduction histidine kinase [Isoptericola jiangsuensis]|uniref:histidine kinase n=1 Tax=Isoptericola jiangsuensis TaxID=548579 RepID=A0A2A9ERA0_9MICO|nr:histidine kinase [Isoptericola jiangsuensis]PFG41524.1 signal transduction histidine kinase [Isoptericola jiangsuensis]
MTTPARPADRRWVASAVMAGLLALLLLTSPFIWTIPYADYVAEPSSALLPVDPWLAQVSWFDAPYQFSLFVSALGGVSCIVAVLLSRGRPVTATVLAAWPFVTILLMGTFVWGWWLALLMITCLVLQDSWRRAVVPLVVTVAIAWLYALTGVPAALPIGPVNAGDYDGGRAISAGLIYTAAVALVVGVAAVIRVANRAIRRSDAAAATERRALEVESVAAERARLARDLHDVVAHHVSLVAVRAESAPYSHPKMDTATREVLAAIASDARSALGELRQVLAVLRRSDEAERAPQPGACDVADLVAAARAAGQDVTLTGRCEDVPDAQGYVLYRAVQEALTNARRHAPGVPVRITLSDVSAVIGLRVTNATSGRGAIDPGRGLIGMRERVEALGGDLSADVEDGEFVLVVTLPVGPEVSQERGAPSGDTTSWNVPAVAATPVDGQA